MEGAMKLCIHFAPLLFALCLEAQTVPSLFKPSIADLRQVAGLIPGKRPLRINVVKFAESRRTKNFSIKGAPAEPSIQARTAFQVVYTDGTVMIDSGMDRQVHNFFGRGVEEPYDSMAAQQVEKAVQSARVIVMTHEHGDHVAGVIRGAANLSTPNLAAKTVLTKTQVDTLLNNPQMPEIKLTPEVAKRFRVIDYESYFPFAPGMALMKSGGHTPGSQMIYVALDSGAEYLFIGDSAWHMDGVRQITGKAAPWIKEDEEALLTQLKWLNELSRNEKDLTIVVSHDDEQRKDYINRKLLGGAFE
jgi:glyoxylase-like metal-dependent hydrolase (beta-lactamase superfamily II)